MAGKGLGCMEDAKRARGGGEGGAAQEVGEGVVITSVKRS